MDKQGLDSFFIIKDQLDEHTKIVSTTVTPNTLPGTVAWKILNFKSFFLQENSFIKSELDKK